MKLRNYTLRYLFVALLGVIALWASLFYMVILDEVYDNIDDGLKNSKILIVRQAYADTKILQTQEFGINQFKVEPLPAGAHNYSDQFISTFEFSEYDNEDQPVRLLKTVFDGPDKKTYQLTIRASMVEEDELMEDLLLALIALYAMLVISIAVLNHLILRKVWHSFYLLLDRLKKYRLGAGNAFVAPGSSVTEFRDLGTELETMLRRNEEIYTSQKQFIENASHELQTPLAISLNKLELFAESNNLPEEQMRELGKISDTLQRLVRLNKSLLMLTKIENRQYTEEETVDFGQLARQLAEDFADLAEYKGVSVASDTLTQLFFTMNKGLALTLVSNLVKNAIVHNVRGGRITIKTTGNSLAISNTGTPSPLDPVQVFRRFSRGGSGESTGLGLSIVQSIAASYSLQVMYEFDGFHKFSIIFP